MTESIAWWHCYPAFLNDVLAFINASRSSQDDISRCEHLCKALNKTWNAFYDFRGENGQLNETELANEVEGRRADNQSFKAFLLQGIGDRQATAFCESDSVRLLAGLRPEIMSHAALLNQRYDPLNITDDVRKKATEGHRRFSNAYQRFSDSPSDFSQEAVLKRVAEMIYVVRCNIAHSEKTPQGPDLAKAGRDKIVSQVTSQVIEDLFDILFDYPSQRLAVYGTLAPDGPNASELAGTEGEWDDGTVPGVVNYRDGFPEFSWLVTAEVVSVKVLSASTLAERFDRLDQFEGPRYRRILAPVQIGDIISICNIYQGTYPASK